MSCGRRGASAYALGSESRRDSVKALIIACGMTLALVAPSHSAFAESSKKLSKYALFEVVRDSNGRPLMTPGGQFVSSNWSGYVLPNFHTGDTYTSVQATWVVPDVPFEKRKHDSTQWIGIGGFCKDPRCKKVDQTLIQLGTAEDPLGGPENAYFAWHQTQPGPAYGTSLAIEPGDMITASLRCNPCTGNQSWTLSMTDLTSGEAWTAQPVPFQSSQLSAEFIEGPSTDQNGIFPLANYGTLTFDQVFFNDVSADLTKRYGIVLRDPKASSNISPLNTTADGFTACFGPRNNPVDCSFIPFPP
jgi:hypothetical protein